MSSHHLLVLTRQYFLNLHLYLISMTNTPAHITSLILKVSYSLLGPGLSPLHPPSLPFPSTTRIHPIEYYRTTLSKVYLWSSYPAHKPSVAPHCFTFYLYLCYVTQCFLPYVRRNSVSIRASLLERRFPVCFPPQHLAYCLKMLMNGEQNK